MKARSPEQVAEPQLKTKRKRLLVAGVLALGLMTMLLWLGGVRMGYIRFLLLRFPEPAELSTQQAAELHAWLGENAVHLQTVAAGSGFEDMQPLKAVIGDARIIALGETHMNREFSQAKHRMIEFLVEEMGFRVVAIEAPFAGALELNDYLLTGDGTPEQALAALVYPAWRIEEVLDMIKWLRRYNTTHEEKVRFHGFDNKPATRSAEAVSNYLRRTNGTRDYDPLLSTLTIHGITLRSWGDRPGEELRDAAGQVRRLIAYLENQRPAFARPSSAQELREWNEWRLAVQHARVLLQNVEFLTAPSISEASDLRDKSMARNVSWIAEYESGAKIILWAANPHITTTPFSGSMGEHLRRRYGNDVVSVGLMCNRKSHANQNGELSSVEKAPSESFEAVLAGAGLKIAVLDLRSLPKGAGSAYFHAPREMANGVTTVLPWAYDVVLFIESTTDARPVRLNR